MTVAELLEKLTTLDLEPDTKVVAEFEVGGIVDMQNINSVARSEDNKIIKLSYKEDLNAKTISISKLELVKIDKTLGIMNYFLENYIDNIEENDRKNIKFWFDSCSKMMVDKFKEINKG